jgi:hypothetical protein
VLCHFNDISEVSIELEVTCFLQIKQHKDIAHFETAYVVKLHRVARLAPPQEVRDHTRYSFILPLRAQLCLSLGCPKSGDFE